jgi:hypothetical protein
VAAAARRSVAHGATVLDERPESTVMADVEGTSYAVFPRS